MREHLLLKGGTDDSEDMLEKAKARLNDCRHISFIQGDVGALPMEDASYDIVMSMNSCSKCFINCILKWNIMLTAQWCGLSV